MNECPKPDPCKQDDSKNRNRLIIGILLAAAAIGAVWIIIYLMLFYYMLQCFSSTISYQQKKNLINLRLLKK